MSSPWRERSAGWRNWTTKSRPPAARQPLFRSTSRTAPGIDRLGAAIHERWGRLDILLANAGVLGQTSPLGHIKPKSWDEVMAVNVTANWRLIRSLDPLLRQSAGGPRHIPVIGRGPILPTILGPVLCFEGGGGGLG